jgi:Domain of unknown function (DUF4384)
MKPLLAFMFVGLSALAQDTSGLHARELFYTPVPEISQPQTATAKVPGKAADKAPDKVADNSKKSAPKRTPAADPSARPLVTVGVAPAPLGLRYSVLKRDDAGKFHEVNPDANFHSGDRIRVQVESNTSGYLYVVSQGSSGAWKLLFPSEDVAGGSNLIQKGDTRVLPSAGDTGWWRFSEQAGVEKLFVVLTRQPESDLDKLIYSMGGAQGTLEHNVGASRTLLTQASVSDDVIARLRQQVSARDLVFEKVDADNGGGQGEKAAYVVNPSAAPDSRLVVDVVLKHN